MEVIANIRKKLVKFPFLYSILTYMLAILFVNPLGDFAVNDDWIFRRQVEAFLSGNYVISAILDPSFIAQGLVAGIWGLFFGTSFVSLRFLTIFLAALFLFVFSKLLKELEFSDRNTYVLLILAAFNPLFFASSFSFMTEIYFLLPTVVCVFFFVKWGKTNRDHFLIISSLFCGVSILVRQIGVVLAIASVIGVLLVKETPQVKVKRVLYTLVAPVVSFCIYVIWPHYVEGGVANSTSFSALSSNLLNTELLGARLLQMLMALPYLVYFFLPFLVFKPKIPSKTVLIIFVASTLFLARTLFLFDLFPLGNVFYIESLYTRSDFRTNFSLFDNIFFKLFFSLLFSFGIVHFVLIFFSNRKKFLRDCKAFPLNFFILTATGMFLIHLFGNDFYDRNLLPVFIPFSIFVLYVLKQELSFVYLSQRIALVLLVIVTLFLQKDYFGHTRLRWLHASELQQTQGLFTQTFVDGTYAKYFRAVKKNDYTGLIQTEPNSDYKCYVQKYTQDTEFFGLIFVEQMQERMEEHIENPKIYKFKKKNQLPRVKNNLDHLIFNDEYFSPIYNLVGKRAYVGTWCVSED